MLHLLTIILITIGFITVLPAIITVLTNIIIFVLDLEIKFLTWANEIKDKCINMIRGLK